MDGRVDALYELDPADFVAARDELVRALKAEGERDAAAEVKALRRPTVAAAAVNRVARDHPDEVTALLEAGRALAAAEEGPALREASRARRDAVQRLVRHVPEQHRDAAAATFEAALTDDEVAAAVTAGRLSKEAEAPATFGFGALPEPSDDPEPAPPEAEPEVDVDALRREAAEAVAALDLAEAAEQAARRALEEAQARREAAERRAAQSEAALREVGC